MEGINQSIKMLLAACRDTEGCMKGCAGGMEGVCRGAPHRKVRGGDMEGYTELCMDCMEEFVEVCREECMERHEGMQKGTEEH